MATRYAHVNIIAKDWRNLCGFYETVFDCEPWSSERDHHGSHIDALTGIPGAHVQGRHLRVPGHGENGPTIEIFTFNKNSEYFPKPFDLDALLRAVAQAVQRNVGQGGDSGPSEQGLPFIGRSQAMQGVYRMITKVLRNDLTVLVTGESGTGKELVAEAIHQAPDLLGVPKAQMSFVVPRHQIGLGVLEQLEQLDPGWGGLVRHVFSSGFFGQQRLKFSFFPDPDLALGATIHCFQGWETRCLVLGIPALEDDSPGDSDNAYTRDYWTSVYIGLTRVAISQAGSHLIVVNEEPRLEEFLRDWFEAA